MKIQQLSAGVLVAGGLLMQMMSVQADLKHTRETRMGQDPKAAPMQAITTYVRKNARREEMRQSYGPVQMNSVTLTLCEKKQSIRLDPKLKIYTVASLDDNGMPIPDAPATPAPRDTDPAGTGKVVMTTSVKDLGEETIAGFKTRHYMITNQIQMSGCVGDTNTNTKMEIWVADIREPMACETGDGDVSKAYSSMKPNCKVTFEQKGDKDAYSKAFNGMIVRMKMYNGDKVMMIQDTTSLSQAKIEDDSLFTVPADYKKVSDDEFQKAQSKAMMDAMMSGAQQGNAGGDDNDGDNDNDAGDAAAGNADNGAEQEANGQEEQPVEEPKQAPKKEEKKKKKFKLPGGFGF